ncbi:related to multiple myeloma protein 2 [Armillaria ostoyae]|nr:related to multiple myeloma protein 2 [Armillaria ostoyae]
MPAVSQAVSARPAEVNQQSVSATGSPRNTLSSSSGIVVAGSDSSPSPLLQTPVSSASAAMISGPITSTGLSFDEEAKLVYGVILSLRNMIKKLSGRDEQFVNYRTSAYKLHLFETISGYKFVMLSDPNADSLRFVLRQIYVGPFLQYVTRNPLVSMDSKECGIDNEYFRSSVDRLVRGLSIFA